MNDESAGPTTYIAYLLRLWRAGSRSSGSVWHASLENPHTGERLAFGDAKALFAFLTDLMACLSGAGSAPPAPGPGGAACVTGPPAAEEDPDRST